MWMRDAQEVTQGTTPIEIGEWQARGYRPERYRWLNIVAVELLSCLVIFSRRPDALLNPQFYAEDGAYFYAQAYNLGALRALALPLGGYLVTGARLAASIAVLFPLSWGSAILNIFAIVIQAAPVAFLFTDRFKYLIPNWYARVAVAFLYLAMPSSSEVNAVIVNSQWHLALLAFLVIIASPPASARWKTFDGIVLLLSTLSGPYCFLLVPIIVLRWMRTRFPYLLRLLTIDLVGSVVQGFVLLTNLSSGRAHVPLGASVVALARIIAGQVFLAGTFGMKLYLAISLTGWWAAGWLPIAFALGGLSFLGFVLPRAPQELKLLWLFGALILFAALFSPLVPGPATYWQRLAHAAWNTRYEFLLILAWLVTLLWTLLWALQSHAAPMLRRIALILLTLTCLVGIPLDWEYPPFTNLHFQAYAQRFEQLPSGSRIVIPLNPVGPTQWTMTLVKH